MAGLRTHLALALIAGFSAVCSRATAEAGTVGVGTNASSDDAPLAAPEREGALRHWWFGGYYRHLWIPTYVTKAFLDRAPNIENNGGGGVVTYRSGGGFNLELGFGFMPYHFHGPFVAKGSEITDTEIARSDLNFYHITSSVMWDVEFHKVVALEIGLGLDFGIIGGNLRRNEAYYDSASMRFLDCKGPLMPGVMGPGADNMQVPYCNTPEGSNPATDPPDKKGEQYNVKDNHVPPVMVFPMIPRINLRIQPIDYLAIKGEFAFGVAQIWVGASLHINFGWVKRSPPPPEPQKAAPPAALPPPVSTGRVLGRVLDAETNTAVAGATIKLKAARALSPLTTEADGRFMVDRLDAGHVRFELEHPDYQPGVCETEIPAQGGDVALDCHLKAIARVGAISGQLTSEDGKPVPSAGVELLGPRNDKLTADTQGLFAAVDLPPGSYRIRVEADGYLMQVVEVTVEAHQTAMPQIILIKKPKKAAVELRKQEIAISEQVQFKLGSAELLGESTSLLRQVADVILRHPEIELVEVQGHTDNKGRPEKNQQLSQDRADAVRDWLVNAGVPRDRLDARGYGQDHPLRPNNTAANRAKNRRVQFILRQQAGAAPQ